MRKAYNNKLSNLLIPYDYKERLFRYIKLFRQQTGCPVQADPAGAVNVPVKLNTITTLLVLAFGVNATSICVIAYR